MVGARREIASAQQPVEMPDQYRAGRMNGIMPVEPFGHQAVQRPQHRNFVAQRHLISRPSYGSYAEVGDRRAAAAPALRRRGSHSCAVAYVA